MGNRLCCKSTVANTTDTPTSSRVTNVPEASVATTSLELPQHKPPPTVEEVKRLFEAVDITGNADDLITAIKKLLGTAQKDDPDKETPSSQTNSNIEQGATWISFIQSGETFFKFADGQFEEIDKENLFHSGDGQVKKVLSRTLQQVGQLHWVVRGLLIIRYLVAKIEKISENRIECLELLQYMFQLTTHINKLKDPEEEEKLRNAFLWITKGAMICASQLSSHKFFSFLKTSANSTSLSSLRTKINQLYEDLTLAISITTNQEQPVLKPEYPDKAVGLEAPKEEVTKLLKIDDLFSLAAVVIYGFGGIGKTTMADAVITN